MFKELKEMLLNNVDNIIKLLEFYDFQGIQLKPDREIRFKRNYEGGPNISIRLVDNPKLIVHDFARGVSTDIFAYIVKERDKKLGEVLGCVKSLLNLDDNWKPPQKVELFGGLYNRFINRSFDDELLPEYPDSVLDEYDFAGNRMFWKDGISFETQKFFHIMYDIQSHRIVIPLYDEQGRLIGVKGRINERDPSEFVPKYLYLKECQASKYLYGYYQNYEHLFGNDVVIGESEKMVMQAYSFGVRNVVAIGSNALSDRQARLILQLSPKRIIFALDEGLDYFQTERNAKMIEKYACMQDKINILCWDYHLQWKIDPKFAGSKNSPTDMGLATYNNIMSCQLVKIEDFSKSF